MPRFIDVDRSLLVTTNMKVLYSTLCWQDHLQQLSEARFAREVLLGGRHRHVMFTRNPYDRLVSAYVDKFQTHPRLLGTRDFSGWQKFQHRFLKRFGMPPEATDEAIRDALLAVDFSRFIEALPALHWRDTHLRPQHFRMSLAIKRTIRLLPLRIDELIPVEDLDHDRVRDAYGIELASVKRNATSHGPADDYFTPRLRSVVNRIYRRDFERLGYPMID